ncbi:thioredoxin fold domain-containing protein [Neopusillimonas maritima]|uniref:Thioredoxin-like fold domain-containing protein n=1 Tax=Neopusillimonas maritima TaxID=2026239 RepID=A0A3A1YW67_9BURK|nr:thioredoxin fold domain-containing protein [Neopusillimonas maritima]RIY41080.1 hypothetical protein CJP73_07990 [Neopusillimonas maritima]
MLKNKLVLNATTAALLCLPGYAGAVNFDALVNAAVQTATQEVTKAIGSNDASNVIGQVVGSATAGTNQKPGNWPAKFVWYPYDKMAPQPVNNGKVKKFSRPEWPNGLQFNSLPFQHAVVRVRGDGSNKIAIFTDPHCPISKKQEAALNQFDNVTIYTFVAPLLGEDSEPMVQQIMCQPTNQDRAQAWDNWILNGIEPKRVPVCATNSKKIISSLGNNKSEQGSIYRKVSPTTIFANNISVVGAMSSSEIQDVLDWSWD